MKRIFVNLKRFDIPRSFGGICPRESPTKWIKEVIDESVECGLGQIEDLQVVFFVPEALVIPAQEQLNSYSRKQIQGLFVGCQGVYREDVAEGKNFGAFTSNRPAAAIMALNCKWAMIGHSEERKDKLSIMAKYDEAIFSDEASYKGASAAVEDILHQELRCALNRNMHVLYCIGETEEQKGKGLPAEYEPRVKDVLRSQICNGLKDLAKLMGQQEIVIGYEPIWAIGPGKTPPDAPYISFVSSSIKQVCLEEFGFELPIVYGGGLKVENAAEIASVKTIDGGLVALTKFTPPIGFDVEGLKDIVLKYIA